MVVRYVIVLMDFMKKKTNVYNVRILKKYVMIMEKLQNVLMNKIEN